jgi:hypothetical protein
MFIFSFWRTLFLFAEDGFEGAQRVELKERENMGEKQIGVNGI